MSTLPFSFILHYYHCVFHSHFPFEHDGLWSVSNCSFSIGVEEVAPTTITTSSLAGTISTKSSHSTFFLQSSTTQPSVTQPGRVWPSAMPPTSTHSLCTLPGLASMSRIGSLLAFAFFSLHLIMSLGSFPSLVSPSWTDCTTSSSLANHLLSNGFSLFPPIYHPAVGLCMCLSSGRAKSTCSTSALGPQPAGTVLAPASCNTRAALLNPKGCAMQRMPDMCKSTKAPWPGVPSLPQRMS